MFQVRSRLNSSVAVIGGGIVVGLAIIGVVGANSVYVNDETERAIVTNSGKYIRTTGPGMHWKIPFQESYRRYPVSIEQMKIQDVSTSTVDNYAINATIVLLYRLPEEKLKQIHRNVPDYQEKKYRSIKTIV
jgi:regulator of protease activity HflC (stomatin/prohibitin superfamily)